MAHNLDINAGQASFVSAREDAWHRLGTVLPDSFTAEQAMEHGLLGGWNVRKVPLYADPSVTIEGTTEVAPAAPFDDEDDMLAEQGPEQPAAARLLVPNHYAVVRDNPVTKGQVDTLGVVGGRYHPIQNEAHAEFLNTLVDESGAHFDTAGALDGGRKVFITMQLPGHIKVGGVDQVDMYLAAVNSHDGSLPFTIMVTPVRIVCQNTLNLAWQGASSAVKLRHTRRAGESIVARARETLDLSFAYLDNFQTEAEQLINTTMTQLQFEEIIQEAFGADEDASAGVITRKDKVLDEMAELFADAYTQDGIRDTAWAGLNTLTEWADHYAPVQSDDTRRAYKAALKPRFKNRAHQLILQHV